MIIAYTVLFLTLFGIIGNVFVQKYKNFRINDIYFEQFYQPYVHRPSKVNINGFNLRKFINNDTTHKKVFRDLLKSVYEKATFYYEDLANDLLELFETQVTFNASAAKDGSKILITDVDDLFLLKPKKKLHNVYFHLMNSSRINKEGFPSLTSFICPTANSSKTSFDLYDTPIEIIEVLFDKFVANDLEISLIRYKNIKNKTQIEKDNFLKDFMTRNRLFHHNNRDLIQFTGSPPLETQ